MAIRTDALSMVQPQELLNTCLMEKRIGRTKLVLLSGFLLNEKVDALVNAANLRLTLGAGLSALFHSAAGQGIFDECEKIFKSQSVRLIPFGKAFLTTAGKLAPHVKAIVHVVGPLYEKIIAQTNPAYADEQAALLQKAYTSALEIITKPYAQEVCLSPEIKDTKPMRTIAFSSIGTGIFDFPLELAAKTALETVKTFIEKNPDSLDEVRFVFLPLDKDRSNTAQYYLEALDKL